MRIYRLFNQIKSPRLSPDRFTNTSEDRVIKLSKDTCVRKFKN